MHHCSLLSRPLYKREAGEATPYLLGALLRSSSLLLSTFLYVLSHEGIALLSSGLLGGIGLLVESIDILVTAIGPNPGVGVVSRTLKAYVGGLAVNPSYRKLVTGILLVTRLIPGPLVVLYSMRSTYERAHSWILGLIILSIIALWIHDLVWAMTPGGVLMGDGDGVGETVRVGGGRTWSSGDGGKFTHYHIHLAHKQHVVQASPQLQEAKSLSLEDLEKVTESRPNR